MIRRNVVEDDWAMLTEEGSGNLVQCVPFPTGDCLD